MHAVAFIFILSSVSHSHLASAWPSSFSTSGFTQVSKPFLPKGKECSPALCKTLANIDTGSCDSKVVDFSKISTNRLSCDEKYQAAKLILDRDDTDEKFGDKQRIELQVARDFDNSIAKPNQSFIYRWWFYLPSNLSVVPGKFFHNFQIKKTGEGEKEPMATFSLDKDQNVGYHLRTCASDSNCNQIRTKLATLSEVKDKWIQAYVKVSFTSRAVMVTAMLANEAGGSIGKPATVKIERALSSDGYRPKFGLYRAKDSAYGKVEYGLFKNFEIWRKL